MSNWILFIFANYDITTLKKVIYISLFGRLPLSYPPNVSFEVKSGMHINKTYLLASGISQFNILGFNILKLSWVLTVK